MQSLLLETLCPVGEAEVVELLQTGILDLRLPVRLLTTRWGILEPTIPCLLNHLRTTSTKWRHFRPHHHLYLPTNQIRQTCHKPPDPPMVHLLNVRINVSLFWTNLLSRWRSWWRQKDVECKRKNFSHSDFHFFSALSKIETFFCWSREEMEAVFYINKKGDIKKN